MHATLDLLTLSKLTRSEQDVRISRFVSHKYGYLVAALNLLILNTD